MPYSGSVREGGMDPSFQHKSHPEPVFVNLLRSPGIDSQPGSVRDGVMDPSFQHKSHPEPVFVNLLRSPGIDSQPGGPVR